MNFDKEERSMLGLTWPFGLVVIPGTILAVVMGFFSGLLLMVGYTHTAQGHLRSHKIRVVAWTLGLFVLATVGLVIVTVVPVWIGWMSSFATYLYIGLVDIAFIATALFGLAFSSAFYDGEVAHHR